MIKKTLKFIVYLVVTLFVLYLLFIGLLSLAFDSEVKEIFAKTVNKEKVSFDIEISEDSNFHVKAKLYDYKNEFIEDNITLSLNGAKMSYSRVPNGYYGHWKYYYLGSYNEKKLFDNAKEFTFSMDYNAKFVELASIKKPTPISKSDITYKKIENGLEINWNNLEFMDKLEIMLEAKIKNKGNVAGYTVVSKSVRNSGHYQLLFKDLDSSIVNIKSVSFKFSSDTQKKLQSDSNVEATLKYKRQYYKTIRY